MGAEVTVLDVSIPKLREIDAHFDGRVRTVTSSAFAVGPRGARAPTSSSAPSSSPAPARRKLVSNELVSRMRPGSVLVDIAIDQGGCFADSRPTTHDDPTYRVHDSVFYCVANMPGAVPHTSTYALTNATLPYVVALAEHGWRPRCARTRRWRWACRPTRARWPAPRSGEAHGIEVTETAAVLS